MNVDTQFPPAPIAALAGRPAQARADQASARPVDRPHHNEPTDNQSRQGAGQTEAHKEARQPLHEAPGLRRQSQGESHALHTDARLNRPTEPAPVGELIDVLA